MGNAKNNGRKQVIDALAVLLADSYLLAFKTHGYHWNVVGEHFVQLHELFGQQYDALYDAADDVAERIRALGAPAPASLAEFAKLSTIEVSGDTPKAAKMIETLRDGHLAAAKSAYAVIAAAGDTDDSASEDLATERVAYHEKAAWMLGALLG